MRNNSIFAALLALSLPGLVRAEPDAVLKRVSGRVEVSPRGELRFEKAAPGAPILLGDQIRTLKDSSAHLVFANGANLLVKENSSFQISGDSAAVSVSFSTGEFLAGLTRPLPAGSSFEVKTPAASAVLAAALVWGRCDLQDGAFFQTFAGASSVTAQGETTLLAPGQSFHIPMGKKTEGPRPPEIASNYLGTFMLEGSLEGLGDLAAIPAPAPQAAALPEPPAPQAAPEAPAAPEQAAFPSIRLELHPYWHFSETYDDNIYLVPPDQPGPNTVGGGVLGAWIAKNDLGLNYAAPLSPKHKIEGRGNFSASNYSKASSANNAYDSTENIGYAYSGRDLTARLSNAYENTMIPAFSELVARQRHWQDATNASFEATLSRRFIYGLDAGHTIFKYLDPTLGNLLNHYEQLFGGHAGIKLAPKTKAYLSYHRGLNHYSAGRNANSKTHQLDASVEGDIAPKLKGLVSAGWQYRHYDQFPGLRSETRDFQTSVALKYQADRNILADLRVFRNFSESTFATNRYYTATGADLSARYTLRRLSANAHAGLEIDRYPEAATAGGLTAIRRDDLYSFGAGADYKLKEWLKAGLNFARINRFSIFSRQFNYADDRTSLELKADF